MRIFSFSMATLLLPLCGFPVAGLAGPLTGVKGVIVTVQALGEDDRRCGLVEEALEAAVRIPLSSSRLRSVRSGSDAIVSVEATTLPPSSRQCAGMVKMTVVRPVWLSQNTGAESISASVWDIAFTAAYDKGDYGKKIAEAVEQMTKMLLGAWLKDN